MMDDHRLMEGHFLSPFSLYMADVMPKEVEIARFQMIMPKSWNSKLKPICVHLGGTGDHYYWRRRTLLAKPLLKESGIASIILENPYYGVRKPKKQLRSALHNVSDLFVMGGALIMESLVLFNWCERQGWGPLGITGISMGGHMASLAASNWNKPLSLIPCLSWTTASGVFTHGILSEAIPWRVLQTQYHEEQVYATEIKKLIQSPEDVVKAYGVEVSQGYPESVEELTQILSNLRNQNKDFIKKTYSNFKTDACENAMSLLKQVGTNNFLALQSNNDSQSRKVNEKSSTVSNHSNSNLRYISPVIERDNNSMKAAGKSRYLSLSYALAKTQIGKTKKSKAEEKQFSNRISEEALKFMRDVMEEFTHLGNYSQPVDTSLIIIVAARQDAYIPHEGVLSLKQIWPEAEVRYIESGHISAFLFNQKNFRQAIVDAFDKQIKKYY